MTDRTPEPETGPEPVPKPPPQAPAAEVPVRVWLPILFLMAALTAAYFTLPLDGIGSRPEVGWSLFGVLVAAVSLLLLRQVDDVLRERPRSRPGLVIPLLVYLSVLIFAAAYYTLARQPDEFIGLGTRFDALYFTLTTFATVGYGDVAPHGQAARIVTALQVVYGVVFLTASATALAQHLRIRLTPDSRHNDHHHR